MIALVSGGLDSVVMLYKYSDDITQVLSFVYGSKHNSKEIVYAKYHAEKLAKPHRIIDVSFLADILVSNLLDKSLQRVGTEPAKTVVPFRNAILLSIAVGMADSLGQKSVLLASNESDHNDYYDCRPSFNYAFQAAAYFGTKHRVKVRFPFQGKDKRQIALLGKRLGVELEKTYSCYNGGEVHCGKCPSCLQRKKALEGFDRTIYAE